MDALVTENSDCRSDARIMIFRMGVLQGGVRNELGPGGRTSTMTRCPQCLMYAHEAYIHLIGSSCSIEIGQSTLILGRSALHNMWQLHDCIADLHLLHRPFVISAPAPSAATGRLILGIWKNIFPHSLTSQTSAVLD